MSARFFGCDIAAPGLHRRAISDVPATCPRVNRTTFALCGRTALRNASVRIAANTLTSTSTKALICVAGAVAILTLVGQVFYYSSHHRVRHVHSATDSRHAPLPCHDLIGPRATLLSTLSSSSCVGNWCQWQDWEEGRRDGP